MYSGPGIGQPRVRLFSGRGAWHAVARRLLLPVRATPTASWVRRRAAGQTDKTVTLITGISPGERTHIGNEPVRLRGSGGAVKDGVVDMHGDSRDRVAAHRGQRFRMKIAGG